MRLIPILCVFFAFVSCTSKEQEDVNIFFNHIRPDSPIKLLELPMERIEFLDVRFPQSMEYSGFCSIFYVVSNDHLLRENELEAGTGIKVNARDSCNLSIGDEFIGDTMRCLKFVPIPSVKSDFSALTDFKIDSTSEFVVEEFEFKYALTQRFIVKSMDLPVAYEHGFSKGYVKTPSGNEIVHWIILW